MAFAAAVPAVMAVVSAAASAGTAAYGAKKTADAGAATSRYQAGIAQLNQKIAKQNEDYTLAAGEIEATRSGLASRFQMGKILTGQGASGVDVNSGSNATTRSSQQRIAQMDEGVIRSNAAHKAWAYDVEAEKSSAEGRLASSASENIRSAGNISAYGSILGGVSSVSSKWMQANQLGIGTSSGNEQSLGGPGGGGE